MSQRQQQNRPDKDTKTPTLRADREGKFNIPLNLLSKIKVNLPAGFETLGLNLVIMRTTSGATEVGLLENRPNLQPLTDLQRLFGARGIITGAAKLQESSDTLEAIEDLMFRSGITIGQISPGPNFRAEMFQHLTHWRNLQASKEIVDKNTITPKGSQFRSIMNLQAKCLEVVIKTQVIESATGTRNKMDLRDMLIAHGTCNYFWTRFVQNRLIHQSNLGLEYILYPTRVENGLKLNCDELRSAAVRGNLHLTAYNSLIVQQVMNPEHYKLIGQLLADNEKDLLRIKRFNWIMVPEIDRALALGTRKFQPRSDRTRSGILTNLNNAVIQLFLGIAPLGIPQKDFMESTLQNVKLDANDPKASITEQAIAAIGKAADNFVQVTSQTDSILLTVFFAGGIPAKIQSAIANMAKPLTKALIVEPEVKALLQPASDAERAVWRTNADVLNNLRGQSKTKSKSIAFGKLWKDAKSFNKQVQDKNHPLHPVRDRVEQYLRQFSTEPFQAMAIRSLEAASDQLESEPDYSSPDEEEDEEA